MKKIMSVYCVLILLGCNEVKKKSELPETEKYIVNLKYAKGFTIEYQSGSKVINVVQPWPNSDTSFAYAIAPEELEPHLKDSDKYEHVLSESVNTIVVTSTTHIPALELLGVEHTLVGFPGCDYISSEKTRERIDNGKVRELGKNEGINTEVLLELNPDLVVGFGVDGVNKTFETIKKTGIPVMYNGDWVEGSPLAKAEWIKFFGVLFNKEKEADSIFNVIEDNYISAKKMASEAINRPTILSGALHKDIWYLPNGSSPEAQFLKDANVDYLWSESSGSGSLALSFESVFEKGKNADIWLSPSYYSSIDQLVEASDHYSKFDAFKTKNIYTFSKTTGKTGGVLYYELGTARPDLVLKDIIKICHPNLLEDYTPFFFKALE